MAGAGAAVPVWPLKAWQSTTCRVTSGEYSWGSDRPLGILSVAAGGSLALSTYDPARDLDPLNSLSVYSADLKPGGYVRMTYLGAPIAFCVIDSVAYRQASQAGSINGTDAVGILSNVTVTQPAVPATTLRAYARQLIALSGFPGVTVEPDPEDGDPAIGTFAVAPTAPIGVWQTIGDAAIDCLRFAWIGAGSRRALPAARRADRSRADDRARGHSES